MSTLPIMWLATLSPVTPGLIIFLPQLIAPFAVAGLILFVLWLWALRPFLSHPLLWWAAAGYFISLLPQMGAEADGRLLYFPFEFAAVLLVMPLLTIRPLARSMADANAPAAPVATRVFGWHVLANVFVPGVFMCLFMPFSMAESMSRPEHQTMTAMAHVNGQGEILLLNTPGIFHTFFPQSVLSYRSGKNLDVRVLSSCNAVMTLERTSERAFVLRADRPGWLSNLFARISRRDGTFEKGRVYDVGTFRATVLEVTTDATDVLAVHFQLTGERMPLLLRWNGVSYEPFDILQLRVGEKRLLADTSDALAAIM